MPAPVYQEGTTFLHRLNPTAKLVAFSFLILVPALVLDPATPAAFLLLALLLGWGGGRVSPLALARRLAPLMLAATGLALFNAVFYGGARGHLVFALGPLRIWAEGLAAGVGVGLRILCIAAYSTLFVVTTDPSALVSSLIHQGRMPYRLGYTLLAAYRFLPILARELASIQDAHRVRGAYERGIGARLRRLRRYAIPLLANGIRRADRLAVAMDARGFGALPRRTYFIRPRVTAIDYLFIAAALLAATTVIVLLSELGLMRGFLGGAAERLVGGHAAP